MKKLLMVVLLCSTMFAQSNVRIMGLRVYANGDEYYPPVVLKSEFITIEFDVATPVLPNLQIVFQHTSKDWAVDRNLFVNDPSKIESNMLNYTTAPDGVHEYTFHYKNSFPNDRNLVDFVYSGNYVFTVIDKNDHDRILGDGKFIIADDIVPTSMTVTNTLLPESSSPWNQVNDIAVDVSGPEEYHANDPRGLDHTDITTVDIIQNWKLTRPFRIDVNVHNPNTFVENFYRPEKQFRIRNVTTGNEYRRMDLSNATTYPNYLVSVLRDGPDVSRFQWQGKPDANGASKLIPFVGANSDYLGIQMNLRLARSPGKHVFVVGGFSDWEIRPAYEMHVDSTTGLYRLNIFVRRGVYDYQYVLADIRDGQAVDEDWFSLEGNDWRTINRYIALVYYHDKRFGGFDRVVGIVRGMSPGGDLDKSVSFPVNSGTAIRKKQGTERPSETNSVRPKN